MKIFKIQNPEGLFSTGGTAPRFNKKGKIWEARGHITSHLGQFSEKGKQSIYKDCVVIEYDLSVSLRNVVNVLDWKEAASTTRAKELEEQRRLEWQKEEKKKQIQKLEE